MPPICQEKIWYHWPRIQAKKTSRWKPPALFHGWNFLVGWCFLDFQPIWKNIYAHQIGLIFPNFRGENKNMKPPPSLVFKTKTLRRTHCIQQKPNLPIRLPKKQHQLRPIKRQKFHRSDDLMLLHLLQKILLAGDKQKDSTCVVAVKDEEKVQGWAVKLGFSEDHVFYDRFGIHPRFFGSCPHWTHQQNHFCGINLNLTFTFLEHLCRT